MNEKELMAIILHEIGHNFYNSIFHTLASISLNVPENVNKTVIEWVKEQLIIKGLFDIIGFEKFFLKLI
jgi:hypothetical protein